jgi:TonB family protein
MSAPLWLQNLATYSLQLALVAAVGLFLPRALRLRAPHVLYSYWQALLAACLLLPIMQPWRQLHLERSAATASHIIFKPDWAASRLATFPLTGLILLVLAGGVALRLMWLALGLAKLRRFRENSRRFEIVPAGIREIMARLGVAPEFRLSDDIESPATFGLRRPLIVVPFRFTELDADRQQAVACHELLHIVRRDWAVNLVEECVLAAFWFHPVVWWLVSRVRLSREQVVDRQVVKLVGARKPYLHALVEIAAGATVARTLIAPAFLNECQLAERIRALVKEELMSKRRMLISLACVVVLTLLAGVAIIRRFPLVARAVAPIALASNPLPTGADVFSVGNGVSAPVPIYKPEPGYTQKARAAKLQGTAVFWTIVGADGAVKDVRMTKSLDPGLNQSAANTISTWKFTPAMKAGKPVACKVMVEVSFRMF